MHPVVFPDQLGVGAPAVGDGDSRVGHEIVLSVIVVRCLPSTFPRMAEGVDAPRPGSGALAEPGVDGGAQIGGVGGGQAEPFAERREVEVGDGLRQVGIGGDAAPAA